MVEAFNSIRKVRQHTDRVILFHSANGKDSIALLDMLHGFFDEIVCVFMYMVKDLEQTDKYIRYFEVKYPKCKFIKVPHFVLSSIIKHGGFGIEADASQKKYNMAMLMDIMVNRTGIEWVCVGFKKYDSMNRRLMLKSYERISEIEAGRSGPRINYTNKRFYPLADWSNKQVLAYIKSRKLITPVSYSNEASAGIALHNGAYLYWCKVNYPNDLEKIVQAFPSCGAILFEYEQQLKNKNGS